LTVPVRVPCGSCGAGPSRGKGGSREQGYEAWAVGTTNPARNGFDIQIAHWNGTTWKTLTPAPARSR
jgi:hypothetical protein